MPMFAVNRYLPDLTAAQLRVLHRALAEAARRVSAEGQNVRYVRSMYVPARNRCVCVFTADTTEAVARANEIAQVHFTHIDEALDPGALS
jgi:hypothetical protein